MNEVNIDAVRGLTQAVKDGPRYEPSKIPGYRHQQLQVMHEGGLFSAMRDNGYTIGKMLETINEEGNLQSLGIERPIGMETLTNFLVAVGLHTKRPRSKHPQV